ncbi:aminopeptidase [Bartonella melophagi]|uniref:Uncharacterized protein n=1 Tax=Bartonella melophagi K-2C TaxID=1094557 RepID=J1K2V4_9HYPH|nr:aminopeptidase [Bartonella melophagi]EJF91827.1 hypothetical protein ME3_00050 [Bartonella melophagi K-2C]
MKYIVDAHASISQKIIQNNGKGNLLNEIAFVLHSLLILRRGLVFYNTLFDENAARYIALENVLSNAF